MSDKQVILPYIYRTIFTPFLYRGEGGDKHPI